MATARQISFEILRRWEESSTFAEDLISQQAERAKLTPADRGLTNALVLGVLRNLGLLDHWIDQLRGRGKLKDDVRNALRLGLFQVLCMRVPDHAAVNESVGLVRKHARGIVNAILRRAVREQDELRGQLDDLSEDVRYSLPEFLVDKWRAQFGTEATTQLCKWSNDPAEIVIRANGLKPEAERIIAASTEAAAIDGQPGFFRVPAIPFDWLDAGLVYAQDPATTLAPRLLDSKPGQRVLDACAAPGGKTALMAELMGNDGEIVASDQSEKRCETLRENLKRMGVKIASVEAIDWGKESPTIQPFDAILLDVPCSNTGVIGRRVDVRWRLYDGFTAHLCKQQLAILEATAPHVKPGGSLVYSTCSIEPEENSDLVAQFLTLHEDFELEETADALPFRDGHDGAFAARLRRR